MPDIQVLYYALNVQEKKLWTQGRNEGFNTTADRYVMSKRSLVPHRIFGMKC